ncbi:MAG TPA: type II secretion system protein GspL [Rhizomicrobium sp.]|nr:type II secretion system protein GspL [Rhizomicrobium sp.]
MKTMRIVILSQEPQRAPLCLTVDEDGAAAWRKLHADDATESRQVWTALVVPGIEAAARWLHLPTHNAAQALAAARLQWEDEVALGGDGLHLALGPLVEDGHRLVVAVSRERMQAWLEEAWQHGVEPDLVIPDHLALPEPEDGDVLAAWTPEGVVIVRGRRLAFACENDILPALLGDRPVKNCDPAAAARLMADGLRDPAVNLLQGEFAPRRQAWDGRLVRIAILAGLLLLSPVLLRLGEALDLHFAAGRLRSETLAAAQQAVPAGAGGDAIAALAQRARQLDIASGGGPAGRIAHFYAALESRADIQLESLRLTQDGGLAISLHHPSPAELESLAAALRPVGLSTAVEGTRPDGGRSVSEVRVGDTP